MHKQIPFNTQLRKSINKVPEFNRYSEHAYRFLKVKFTKLFYIKTTSVISIPLLKDDCQSCDCVGASTQTSGVYEIMIGGDRKLVYCSFEAGLSWTVSLVLHVLLLHSTLFSVLNIV